MFQSLRVGTPFYVLHKNVPKIEIGEVLSVSAPMPQYDATYHAGMLMQSKSIVDISIKIGEQTIRLEKLQADREVDDYNGMVVSANKIAIINEIENLRKSSLRALDEVTQHQSIVEECDKMMMMLNPEIKQEAERDAEIKRLGKEISELKEMLAVTLGQTSKKETK